MRVDAHQHVWTQPLIDRLAARSTPPRLVRVGGEAILEAPGEPACVVEPAGDAPAERLERDGLDLVVVSISSPIGIESLPRAEATALIDAQLTGVEALGPRFAAWGPIALHRPDPDDVDGVLERDCVGISVPAGALATPARMATIAPVLERIADRGVPLFVHPGPSPGDSVPADDTSLETAPWWKPMTGYVSQMQSAWLTFSAFGRSEHPTLIVLFAMLAGGAPLLSERLSARRGPVIDLRDPLTFYDTSSFGPFAIEAMVDHVGESQLIYGSDRPIVEPAPCGFDVSLQTNAARLLSASGRAA